MLSLSVDEIADMDREVEDILQDSDGGETDDEQEPFVAEDYSTGQKEDKSESTPGTNSFKDYVCSTQNNRTKCDSTHSICM